MVYHIQSILKNFKYTITCQSLTPHLTGLHVDYRYAFVTQGMLQVFDVFGHSHFTQYSQSIFATQFADHWFAHSWFADYLCPRLRGSIWILGG